MEKVRKKSMWKNLKGKCRELSAAIKKKKLKCNTPEGRRKMKKQERERRIYDVNVCLSERE